MRRGELRAAILSEARKQGIGVCFAVRRSKRPGGQTQATSELMEQVEAAIRGWALYVEIDRITPAGDVVIKVLRRPPDFTEEPKQ